MPRNCGISTSRAMVVDVDHTIGGCVAYARQRLPRHEADLLVSRSLDVPQSHLYAFEERTIAPVATTRLKDWIARRSAGEPVAYILRERGFWGLDLEVSPDVLIPRPETETLIEAALPLIGEEARVLDMGTGSGAVALAIASERPRAEVTATDIEARSLAICQRNAARLGLPVKTVLADCLEGVGAGFDVIVSNPPYVDDADPRIDQGDLRFEPRLALLGGPNGGLDFLARLIREATAGLAPQGWLCVEHGCDQGSPVARLFGQTGFEDVRGHLDLENRPRVTVGRWGSSTA